MDLTADELVLWIDRALEVLEWVIAVSIVLAVYCARKAQQASR